MSETMTCKRCGGDNPADARFCIDCGATLVSATTGPTTRLAAINCPACQTHNPEHARFCVVCGRSLGKATAPQAARSAPPQRAPARPQIQAHQRTATPPMLTPYRPAPQRPAQPRPYHQNPAPFIFLIGLVLLFANHVIWPGILILIGISILISQVAHGRPYRGMGALFWVGGIALLLATGAFWPGILVLFLLNAIWHRHGYWHLW